MDREKALELLRGGADGIPEWNRLRGESEEIPDLSCVVLCDANLIGVNLTRASLGLAKLDGSGLSGAVFCNAELTGAGLSGADLHHANLSGANLSGSDLTDAELIGANLTDANLTGARLAGANLRHANLSHANLSLAVLAHADLTGARLAGANLSGAKMVSTVLSDLDLSDARSIDQVEHLGPSSLGIDTVIKSGGEIPQSFLEGCGVPDNWITYLPSLLGKPIDFYSCFISYSHQDEEFSKRLYSRMREDKLRVWYALEDMKAGRKIHEQIDTAIRLHDKLLVVLSEHSMQSEWVKTEIRNARQREVKEGKRVLFPIRLVPVETIRDWKAFDADTGKDMAVEIREYFIPDFTNWKDHDAFEATYQRLMKDFKPAPDDE